MRTRPDPRLRSAIEDGERLRDRNIDLEETVRGLEDTVAGLRDQLRGRDIRIAKLVQQITLKRTRGR